MDDKEKVEEDDLFDKFEEGGVWYEDKYANQAYWGRKWKNILKETTKWTTEEIDVLRVKINNVLKETSTGDKDKEKIKEAVRLLDEFTSKNSSVGGTIRIGMVYDMLKVLVS